eukprot:1151448-Pelagomonas_calceolata.AAC.2
MCTGGRGSMQYPIPALHPDAQYAASAAAQPQGARKMSSGEADAVHPAAFFAAALAAAAAAAAAVHAVLAAPPLFAIPVQHVAAEPAAAHLHAVACLPVHEAPHVQAHTAAGTSRAALA